MSPECRTFFRLSPVWPATGVVYLRQHDETFMPVIMARSSPRDVKSESGVRILDRGQRGVCGGPRPPEGLLSFRCRLMSVMFTFFRWSLIHRRLIIGEGSNSVSVRYPAVSTSSKVADFTRLTPYHGVSPTKLVCAIFMSLKCRDPALTVYGSTFIYVHMPSSRGKAIR